MFMSEAGKISQKVKVWFSDYFNLSDFLAIVTFFVGFGLRIGGEDVLVPGRTVYCLNIIFWYVRLLDILAVNQQAGPYVMMIGKMVSVLFFP
jgi:transient receptor potential cation channel subfamily M protein 7